VICNSLSPRRKISGGGGNKKKRPLIKTKVNGGAPKTKDYLAMTKVDIKFKTEKNHAQSSAL
jgi:hypothetical protein